MDNTGGTKSNQVSFNIPHVLGALDAPEAGVACVFIDGIPIHAPHYISMQAGIGQTTKVCITFECEVSGIIAGKPVEQMIKESKGE
jgi:hypothetical protein